MTEIERPDGRKEDELREIKAKVGIIPNADGSAMFAFGDTIAIAAVYGPKKMHPQHKQDPERGTLRCNYSMISFSVTERIKPGQIQEIPQQKYVSLVPSPLPGIESEFKNPSFAN